MSEVEVRARFAEDDSSRLGLEKLLGSDVELHPQIARHAVDDLRALDNMDICCAIIRAPRIPGMVQAGAVLKLLEAVNENSRFGARPHLEFRIPILEWLGTNWLEPKKRLWQFLKDLLDLRRNYLTTFQRLNPILIGRAYVFQQEFDCLLSFHHSEEVWTAIPFLWQLATTLRDGKRITLAEAVRQKHQLHAISALMALYAQTSYAKAPSDGLGLVPETRKWLFENILTWPADIETDQQLIDWFHGPYLESNPTGTDPSPPR